jgi:replication fork clamp-binding protein CrfC
MTDRERIEVEIIKSLIRSYFNIVRKNIGDLVPKTVMYFLVNHAKENVQSVLVQRLYRDSSLEELLRETNDAAQRRKNCAEVQGLLRRALEIVNEVRDFSVFQPSGSTCK